VGFYQELDDWCRQLLPLVHPDRERESWRRLLADLRTQTRSTQVSKETEPAVHLAP